MSSPAAPEPSDDPADILERKLDELTARYAEEVEKLGEEHARHVAEVAEQVTKARCTVVRLERTLIDTKTRMCIKAFDVSETDAPSSGELVDSGDGDRDR